MTNIVLAFGDGPETQPRLLPELVDKTLTSAIRQALRSVDESLADTQDALETEITITHLRPGRWVGHVCIKDQHSELANDLVLANAVVSHLRLAGKSAVLGPADNSHLQGFINRNRATYVSDDLAICFPWAPCDAEQVVEIDPGTAFGAGSHPSTVLAARELASALAKPHQSVLDVGCGSGVLALVAARCGAGEVLGIDIDPDAVRCSQRNAEINGLEHIASFSTTPVSKLTQTYDVVIANIGARTLGDLAPELAVRLAPGARIILSGISPAQISRLQAQFVLHGPTKLETCVVFEAPKRLDDWCVLVGTRR